MQRFDGIISSAFLAKELEQISLFVMPLFAAAKVFVKWGFKLIEIFAVFCTFEILFHMRFSYGFLYENQLRILEYCSELTYYDNAENLCLDRN